MFYYEFTEKLNELYEKVVTEIRKISPTRIIIISPRIRSGADYLKELKIPTKSNGYIMAEWHFYASGPSKTNEKKLWTTGTEEEKQLITNKINIALEWQKNTGIPTWVGAWMPSNYNDGNDYSINEQVKFAKYMSKQLYNVGIPFAVNSDTKFYNREFNKWVEETQPVFESIFSNK
ncbi:cellulase family glycosylhydrolase [Crassaminicella thermophila]|uniref:cellulase family glycosylhydrolase n=1 Tax=Crassaminicella thermophila TaxID=2599308 RepID=UPI0038CC0CFF